MAFNEDWKFSFKYETRLKEQGRCWYYDAGDLGLAYSGLHEKIKIGANCKLIEQFDDEQWRSETRPYTYITYKDSVKCLDWFNTTRTECRIFENKSDLWRVRNKAGIKLPPIFEKTNLRPYLSDEVFFNFDGQGYAKNRIYAGCTFNLTEKLKGDFYYFWEKETASAGGQELNVAGLKLTYYF
ncbi:MAG: DUF2490 domain-containing protein [Phycisphaerae bacterium]|nr:DUF2490 domain-containing protein [Phycisphaerae bacterium]